MNTPFILKTHQNWLRRIFWVLCPLMWCRVTVHQDSLTCPKSYLRKFNSKINPWGQGGNMVQAYIASKTTWTNQIHNDIIDCKFDWSMWSCWLIVSSNLQSTVPKCALKCLTNSIPLSCFFQNLTCPSWLAVTRKSVLQCSKRNTKWYLSMLCLNVA